MSQTVNPAPANVQALQDKRSKHLQAIQEMEKHLSVASDRSIVLNVKSAADIQVDPDAFNELSQSLQALNQLLRTGQVHPSQIRLKTETHPPVAAGEALVTAAGTCNGQDNFATYWWGMRLWTDECKTRDIINDAGSGGAALGAIAAVLNLIPGVGAIIGSVLKVASLLLGVGSSAMNFVDGLGNDNGLEFSITWLFIISWFWHQ